MNFDKIDLEALQRDLEEFAREQQQRGWFRRNWRWFVPTLLLAVIVLGGAAIYWSLFLRIYNLEVCRSAMQTIQADKGIAGGARPADPDGEVALAGSRAERRIEEREIDVLEHRGTQRPRQGACQCPS